jgi:hypothetical protein
MEIEWLNDDDKGLTEDGEYVAVINNAQGHRVSTFKGKSYREVADKALQSMVHANREISRLRKPDAARPPLRVEPKQLSEADRLRLSTEITDPDRVIEAVEEIVTARQGMAPAQVGKQFSQMDKTERDAFYAAEAQAFRDEHPDFYPVPQNRDALFDELKANGWDLTRNNLAIAYQTLKDREDVIPWPEGESESEPAPSRSTGRSTANGQETATAPSPRPRSVSTGIRNTDASALAPLPPKKAKYTRADVERMSRAEYNDKIRSDPDFRRQVDAMSA